MPIKPAKPTRQEVEELLFLKEQERLLIRERALNDYWFFLTKVLWPGLAEQHFYEPLHKPIADNITTALPGCRDLLIMTRKGRKTFLRTIGHSMWRITRDPDVRILVISSLDGTSKEFLGGVKRQFQHNESYAYYFPEMAVKQGKLGNEEEFTHPARKNIHILNPTMKATYLGASILGTRADIIILDDPIAEKHVTTPEQIDKAMGWVNDIFPILDENERYGGMMFVNGTLKSFADPYAAMLGRDRGADQEVSLKPVRFKSVVVPALADKDGNPDINGTPTFPTVLTRERLEGYLADAEMDPSKGTGYFYREYLCQCQAPSERKFFPEWFDTWTPVLPSTIVWSGIVVDSASKDKQVLGRGDYTVALVGHMDQFGHLYLTDGARSNEWRSTDLMRELVGMAQRSGVYNLVKEKVGEEIFFGTAEEAYARQRLPCTTYALSVRQEGKKIVRIIEALQAPAQGRRIHFVTGFPTALHRILVDEAVFLGQWLHDDTIDALSLFYHKTIRIIPSSHRSVPWTPMTHARLPQASTSRFVPSAAFRTRPPQASDDGSIRGYDPFVQQVLDGLGGPGETGPRAPGRSPFPYDLPIIRRDVD